MKPYEGDYMRNLIGNRLQREFRYDAPGKVDQIFKGLSQPLLS